MAIRRKRVRRWWSGEWKIDTTPHLVHFYRDRSLWADGLEKALRWSGANFWQIIGTIIALATLYVGWLAVR